MPVKTKSSPNKKKNEKETPRQLTRQPLYPEIHAEKENMGLFSSDDSPDKSPYTRSPRMPRKGDSPSSTDSMEDMPSSPKRRSGRHQHNQMQDSENSDVDMEAHNFIDSNYRQNQRQEECEISPDTDVKKHLSPKSDRCENYTGIFNQHATPDLRRRINPPKMQSQRTVSSNDSGRSFLPSSIAQILFGIFFVSLFGLYMFWPIPGSSYKNDQLNASTLVNSLKSEFKKQPLLTFRIISSSLRNVLEGQPEAPAIILLLATNGSETVCSEFARKLVDLLSVPGYTVKISGKDYKQENINSAKMDIDNSIADKLKVDQLGSVLINDLDQIPGQAAMILHKYCDHENAPLKKAVYVMTANYNKVIDDYDTKTWDKAANDHLLSVWTDIGVDQVTPLLARLTVSVAVIIP